MPHLDVLDAQLLHDARWKHARGKGTAEDGFKLLVQASDAKLLEVHLLGLEDLVVGEALLAGDLDGVAARVGEQEGGVGGQDATLRECAGCEVQECQVFVMGSLTELVNRKVVGLGASTRHHACMHMVENLDGLLSE